VNEVAELELPTQENFRDDLPTPYPVAFRYLVRTELAAQLPRLVRSLLLSRALRCLPHAHR